MRCVLLIVLAHNMMLGQAKPSRARVVAPSCVRTQADSTRNRTVPPSRPTAQGFRERVVRSEPAQLEAFVAATLARDQRLKQSLDLQTFLETNTAQMMLTLAEADDNVANEADSGDSSEDDVLDQAI